MLPVTKVLPVISQGSSFAPRATLSFPPERVKKQERESSLQIFSFDALTYLTYYLRLKMKPISTQIYFPAIHLNPTIKEISDFHILQCTWIWDSIQPYDPSNTFAHARLVFTHYVTEYPPKLGDILEYHLGEYSPIFKPTSTTISLHLNFDSRWESVYWLLQKKENICLFIKPYQSTLKRKDTTQQIENCSKQFFHMHCRIMIWRIKTQWLFFFCSKTCSYICPWVPRSE